MPKAQLDHFSIMFFIRSGVADQLQSNFATDLRCILKVVFLINASLEEDKKADPSVDEECGENVRAAVSESSSVEEAMEAHESYVEEDADDDVDASVDSPLVFPLPVEESPANDAGKLPLSISCSFRFWQL